MTANGERLSAVARRRRLRDAQLAAPTAPAPAPASADDAQLTRPVSGRSSPQVSEPVTEVRSVGTSNQFSALVDASAVHFSSSKEVDQLSETSVKIRLSRGQNCVIVGTCTLWVKQGSVFIYGATIHASTSVHQIYAPNTHALPAIEALSSKAEFQLDSLDAGLTDLPYIGVRDLWVPANVKQTTSSFYVLGHSFDHDPRLPRRLKELNLSSWKPIISGVLPSGDTSSTTSPPRILLCGRRCSGVSTLARCLVNRIVTRQNASTIKTRHTGVLVLDLDTNMPEFAPPGTISLVHVVGTQLGPSFTHVLTATGRSNRILRTHFLGDVHFTDLCDWHIDRVLDLVELAKQHCARYDGTPVLVLAPKWWNGIEQKLASQLWTRIAPTDIICLDASTASPHLQPWKSVAETGQCRVHQLPGQVFDKIYSAREHDLQMQSYFHLVDSSTDHPLWNDLPILAGTHHELTLSYGGDDADVCSVILLGGHVALEDTYDALEGNLVAIVAVKRPTDRGSMSDCEVTEDSNTDSSHVSVSRTEEGLPRLHVQGGMRSRSLSGSSGEDSFCVAVAMVVKIDIPSRQITLVTGPSLSVREVEARKQGHQVALVLQKATTDGRFRPDWARKEMEDGDARWRKRAS
ncbi:hypothetical protein A1O3_01908 [Capronia epimyces CBS 606.96]|uniref:Polynucleotide 5'-hydroxyl-kinase GRC3 n=1 Tax=Capronia epimyces CBS 606.96 TaxID=1182542 RepID=W9Z2Y5_9EURO|nr:uncharacterized protein A1O3_01908 [Capronia epimyces CBS 606.96]EXJ88844.1 hypothetical protein A1O3_01908 [Capronia epimyces CBS 606.96]